MTSHSAAHVAPIKATNQAFDIGNHLKSCVKPRTTYKLTNLPAASVFITLHVTKKFLRRATCLFLSLRQSKRKLVRRYAFFWKYFCFFFLPEAEIVVEWTRSKIRNTVPYWTAYGQHDHVFFFTGAYHRKLENLQRKIRQRWQPLWHTHK